VADAKTLRDDLPNDDEGFNMMLAHGMMMLEHRIRNIRRERGNPLRW
jgi:hypothetical protein